MSELISGKEALIALANGDDVEWTHFSIGEWHKVPQKTAKFQYFLDDDLGWKFRLKPRTIMIGDVEVPAPFEPKDGDIFWHIDIKEIHGYNYKQEQFDSDEYLAFGAWSTESEIKQVVAALRKLFKG